MRIMAGTASLPKATPVGYTQSVDVPLRAHRHAIAQDDAVRLPGQNLVR